MGLDVPLDMVQSLDVGLGAGMDMGMDIHALEVGGVKPSLDLPKRGIGFRLRLRLRCVRAKLCAGV